MDWCLQMDIIQKTEQQSFGQQGDRRHKLTCYGFIFRPLIPYTLALFINYFSKDKTPETYRNAHIYSFELIFLSMLTSLLLHHVWLSQGRVGMRVRIASCSLLYRKVSMKSFYISTTHNAKHHCVIYIHIYPCKIPLNLQMSPNTYQISISYVCWRNNGFNF